MAQVKLYLFDVTSKVWKPHDSSTDEITFKSINVPAGSDLIGGIQRDNLVDKSATESISGAWTFGTVIPKGPSSDPTLDDELTRKAYVDAVAAGLRDFKDSVKAVTVAALPAGTRSGNKITADAPGAFPQVDGITINTDGTAGADDGTEAGSDSILINNAGDATAADRGIHYLSDPGDVLNPWVLTRRSDADSDAEVTPGMYVFTEEGATKADTAWILTTTGTISLNTTGLTFAQFSSLADITAGAGLSKTGSTLAVEVDTNPGLEFDTGGDAGKLRVKVATAEGVQRTAAGVGVNLQDTNPTLAVVSTELGVKFDSTLQALAAGLSVKGLPLQFEINSVATSANVTAANLGTLTAGTTSDADSLHTHPKLEGSLTLTSSGGWNIYDPIRLSGNDTGTKVGIDTIAQARLVGLALSTEIDTVSGKVQVAAGTVVPAVVTLANETPGAPVYWSGSVWDVNLPASGKFTSLAGYVTESDGIDGSFVFTGPAEPFIVP